MQLFPRSDIRPFLTRTAVAGSTLALLVSLVGCDSSIFANTEKLSSDATQALNAKNFSEAGKLAQRWVEKAPNDYNGQFVLAQAKAQTGDKNAALVALEQAIKLGLKDDEQIEKSTNLEPIKSMTAYKDLMTASFPSRAQATKPMGLGSGDAVSIQIDGDKQVVRAGDVVVSVPTAK